MRWDAVLGHYVCRDCGATEQGFQEARELRELDWQRGGTGKITPERIKELQGG